MVALGISLLIIHSLSHIAQSVPKDQAGLVSTEDTGINYIEFLFSELKEEDIQR